jgi:hypothetical protein
MSETLVVTLEVKLSGAGIICIIMVNMSVIEAVSWTELDSALGDMMACNHDC